jgi:CHAT domain-containing protein/tetratricopeptide (TPR) repeat protein
MNGCRPTFLQVVLAALTLAISQTVTGPALAAEPSRVERLLEETQKLAQAEQWKDALAHARTTLGAAEKLEPRPHPLLFFAWSNLAECQYALGLHAEARASFAAAVNIGRQLHGAEHIDVLVAMMRLSDVSRDMGDLDASLELETNVITVLERTQGPDHPGTITVVLRLSEVQELRRDYLSARTHAERVLSAYLKIMAEEESMVPETLHRLGNLCRKAGDLSAAVGYFQRALKARVRARGDASLEVAETRNALGLTLQAQGDFKGAEDEYKKALEIRIAVLGREHDLVAESLNNLGYLHLEKGDTKAARPFLDEALAIRKKLHGLDSVPAGRVLLNLGSLFNLDGELRLARVHYEQAASIFNASGSLEALVATTNLGMVHYAMGDLNRAMGLLQPAAMTLFQTYGPNHPQTATSFHNIASILHAAGNDDQAAVLAQKALSSFDAVFGRKHLLVANALSLVGEIARARGDLATAVASETEAHAIREALLGASHPDVALSLQNLGVHALAQGDHAKASRDIEQALAVLTKTKSDSVEVANALNNLAIVKLVEGRTAEGLKHLARANQIEEKLTATRLLSGTEAQKTAYVVSLENFGHLRYYIALSHPGLDSARVAFDAMVSRKGRVLEAAVDQSAVIRRQLDKESQGLFEALSQAQSRFSTLSISPPQNLDLATVERLRKSTETEVSNLSQLLADRSENFATMSRPITADTVAKALPTHAALVEYAVYLPPRGLATAPNDIPRYVAFILTPKGRPVMRDLGPADIIDSAILALSKALAERRGAPRVKALALFEKTKRLARELDTLIFEPIIADLGTTRELIIAPDGELARIPFEALVAKDGRMLVERFGIQYVTSGRDLVRLSNLEPPISSAPVALGGVDFDAAPGKPAPESLEVASRGLDPVLEQTRWSYLPGTAEEVRGLTSMPLFTNASSITGNAATEAALRALKSPRILHLATHGFFLPVPQRAVDLLSTPSGFSVPNPLLRAGLALSGANKQRTLEDDDGILTALEASSLDLSGTELVVLSACETGLGDARLGDGISGMRRAIALAGARTQVVSLWKVDDDATSAMMLAYYQRLARGEGRAEAMRQVRLAMLAGGRNVDDLASQTLPAPDSSGPWTHPYFWASFLVSGEAAPLARSRR